MPTTATLSLGVDSRATTAKAAIAANAREMRAVIDAVKAAGGRNVGTQSVSLSQVFGPTGGDPTGFAASNVVSATIDVDKAGEFRVMASHLLVLKSRSLLPADAKRNSVHPDDTLDLVAAARQHFAQRGDESSIVIFARNVFFFRQVESHDVIDGNSPCFQVVVSNFFRRRHVLVDENDDLGRFEGDTARSE